MTQEAQDHPQATRRPALLVAGCCLLLLATAAAGAMRAQLPHPSVAGLDHAWLSAVTRSRSAGLTELFKVLSLIGGPVGGTIIVAAGCLALLTMRRWRTALYIALAEASGSACSQLIKHAVLRHRPPHPLVTADLGSFPSGHVITTLGVGLALTVAFFRPGHRRYALAAVAGVTALMMYCRTYLAAHWLTDTIESVLVAGGLGLILWWIFEPGLAQERGRPFRLNRHRDPQIGAAADCCQSEGDYPPQGAENIQGTGFRAAGD
jgi:membrane-associated phospholipid phosphatase